MLKKDSTLWLCVNFSGLNEITKKNQYPLLLISEAIDHLFDSHYFTKLDICQTYQWLWSAPRNQWKTAFSTHYSHYEYTILSFSLINITVAFQGHINNMLHKYLDQCCIANLDNIVFYLNYLEEHQEHIWFVLTKFQEAGLYLKFD